MRLTPTELMTLLDAAGLDTRQYSGRGMYGNYCPAFTVDNDSDILAAGFEIAQALIQINSDAANVHDYVATEDMVTMLANAKTDSMGNGTVVYFPRYTFEPVATAVEAN